MESNSLVKSFPSTIVELKRSEIHPAGYNPRVIDDEAKKALKRSIKKFGVVGGIVVNKRTGNTIVGGHQKVSILDEMYKYPANDYTLRVEMIDVDMETEKTLNIALNNGNISGRWDYEKLAQLIPDIDYKDAGLTDADLNMIGVDYLLQTEEENNIADELDDLMSPIIEEREEEKAERAAEREMQKAIEREAKVQHMKDVKQQVKEEAISKAEQMDAYVMLSFSSWSAKSEFCERFGYPAEMKIIKGEVFAEQVERIE
jgi:hypothetical protein